MGNIMYSSFLFLASTFLFKTAMCHTATAKLPMLAESSPAPGYYDHSKRQEGVEHGTACSGCTQTDYGCECSFGDESWIEDIPPTEEEPEKEPEEEPANEPLPPPPPPEVNPVNPPGSLQCEPNPEEQPKDSHGEKLVKAAQHFCRQYASSEDQDPGGLPIEKTLFVWGRPQFRMGFVESVVEWKGGDDSEDDVYDLKIKLIDDCKNDGPLNLQFPVDDHECATIFKSAWDQCNNQGRGGSLVAGCLRYSVRTVF